uniref:Superoxide dismutase copper/zinc binding domain-containing protein n=1 Tax=Scleropages formosus TaxID=113540 RepID=A0A8C9UAR4_SCLFO
MPNGTRQLCGSIGYPGDVVVAKATFKSPVVGTILFTQLKSNSYSDVSIFVNLAYGKSSTTATHGHNWHIHAYPIRTETDDDANRCWSTGAHWNPFNINISDSSYTRNCRPDNPFACEIGDLTGKQTTLSVVPDVGKIQAKYFFTDLTSWVNGTESMIGRSVVIHGAGGAPSRMACVIRVSLLCSSAVPLLLNENQPHLKYGN